MRITFVNNTNIHDHVFMKYNSKKVKVKRGLANMNSLPLFRSGGKTIGFFDFFPTLFVTFLQQ